MDNIFFRQFLKNPFNIGAAAPLSKRVAQNLIKFIKNRNRNAPCKILEVGGGIGNITSGIIAEMGENDLLDAVEIDPAFCALLQKKFGHDRRVNIHCLSILDWKPSYKYNYIISTLPMNMFPPDTVTQIFALYQHLLNEEGVFTYVEYMGLAKLGLLFSLGKTKKMNQERIYYIDRLQKDYLIEKVSIIANFLPCNIYHMKFNKRTA